MEKYNMNLKREVKDGVMQIYDNLYPVFTKQASSPVDSKSGNVYLSVILFVCLCNLLHHFWDVQGTLF